MHSGNATQDAMCCKCIAVRRIAVRKLPRLPPCGRRNQKSLISCFMLCISTRLVSYLTETNPFLGFFLSIYTVWLPASSGDEFAAKYVKGLELAFGLPLRLPCCLPARAA